MLWPLPCFCGWRYGAEDWFIFSRQIHGTAFKKQAPTAIKAIREFATKAMVSASLRHSFMGIRAHRCRDHRPNTSTPHLTSLHLNFHQSNLHPLPHNLTRLTTHRPIRTPKTSVSTHSSTRKSGTKASKVSPANSASASPESATTRKAPKRSSTATCRRSMSPTQRAWQRSWWRMLDVLRGNSTEFVA